MTQYTERRPAHPVFESTPYFVTTRTHRSRRPFVSAKCGRAAVDALFDLAATYDFKILAFVFMADHAHFVILPGEGRSISAVMRIIKGGIARRINALEGRAGKLWQEGFFDKVPKDLAALNEFIRYVEDNPGAANLVRDAVGYEFSSARGQCLKEYHAFVEGTA